MEFLRYDKILSTLADQGVVEVAVGELLHFELDAAEAPAGPVKILFAPSPSTPSPSADSSPADHFHKTAIDQLGSVAEQILHRLKIADVAIIPALWRDIFDIAVFDLARNEVWLEVDTDATLHQNTRDPLVVPPKHRHIVATFVTSLMAGGESPRHNLTIAALGSPFLITIAPGKSMVITCASEGVARTLLTKLA